MLINDIFEKDVARDINPVVYFHEDDPAKVAEEVSEYIITGGYPEGDPRHNEHGIHEQFVRLLTGIAGELESKGGTPQPAAWISGFYGSGKSSFAKLLGLALNETRLPDGTPLSRALLKQDDSPKKAEFEQAWGRVVSGIKPMAVVFDIGSVARDDEHIHSAVVRRCQEAMGYCPISAVADHEIKLEVENLYPAFLEKVKEVHGKSWEALKESKLADDYFSAVLHALQPDIYDEKMAWADAKAGSKTLLSAEEAVQAIQHMLDQRKGGRTLFIVVDEVSQYVHDDADRMLKLQSLVVALGQRLKGRVWLLATGQQKLEEGASATTNLSKMKDRFPAHLRVHLGSNNIRDVVHQRLLKKKHTVRAHLEELFDANRADLSLYAHEAQHAKMHDLVDIYPLLPGHIDLLMEITTGLRDRSSRVQGDSHAIRGLLQLLGDLFRDSNLGAHEVGTLITIDRIYDVLHTALDADVQTTLTRAFEFCTNHPDLSAEEKMLAEKTLKAVSLLELIADERVKRDADYVARSLYERLGQGSQKDAIQKLLDALRGSGHVDYSEKSGYKIQSSAGQEWQKERDAYAVGPEKMGGKILEALSLTMPGVEKADRNGLAIPWQAWFSNAIGIVDAQAKTERSATKIEVDFRYLPEKATAKDQWVSQSDTGLLKNRVLWVAAENDEVREATTKLIRAERMIERYEGREASLTADKRRFLTEERNNQDDAQRALKKAVEGAFLQGSLYFRGKDYEAREHGTSIATVLADVGERAAKLLYPNPVTFRVTEGDLKFLVESKDLAAPPPVFGEGKLGLLVQDSGRFEATCAGAVPSEIFKVIQEQSGISGSSLLSHFGGPPHGLTFDIVRACLVGLMRGHKLRVRIPGIGELTRVSDEGARELFKENTLRKSEFFPNNKETITARDKNAICKLFLEQFGKDIARDDDAIADAVGVLFSSTREQLSELQHRLSRLPNKPQPKQLDRLEKALEDCRRSRQVDPILEALKRSLTPLSDGLIELRRLRTDLSEEVVHKVKAAKDFEDIFLPQLSQQVEAGHLDASSVTNAAAVLREGLMSDRPWEATASLSDSAAELKTVYVKRRGELLDAHESRCEEALQSLKLRDGFDTLSQDNQHQVLQHVREGAAFNTRNDSPAPSLHELESQSAARLGSARERALAQLDEFRESKGERPTVTVPLRLSGREIEDEKALDRFLNELREQLLKELQAGRRVRLQ
jgi:hypothetical protein